MQRRQIWMGLAASSLLMAAGSVRAQTPHQCPNDEFRGYTVYFLSQAHDVNEDGLAVILAFADFYKFYATSTEPCVPQALMTNVTLTGHTDTAGSAEDNLALSRRWAEIVAAKLIEAGVPKDIIHVVAVGESDPAIQTPDNDPEPLNRRVTIDYEF